MPEMTGDTANGRSISVMQQVAAREPELGDRPAGGEAEEQIGGHGDRRGEQRQPERGERIGLGDGGAVGRPAVARTPR